MWHQGYTVGSRVGYGCGFNVGMMSGGAGALSEAALAKHLNGMSGMSGNLRVLATYMLEKTGRVPKGSMERAQADVHAARRRAAAQ